MDLHVINKYFNETENYAACTKAETSQNRPIIYSIQYACILGGTSRLMRVVLYPTLNKLVDVAESIFSDGESKM
jgi:hypothetical protein